MIVAEPAGAPPVGTIGVVSTRHLGSWYDELAAWGIQWGTQSPVNHAVTYVGDGRLLEARPSGSGWNDWDAYPGIIWLTSIPAPSLDFYAQEEVANSLCGIGYGWPDIAAIAIAQRRFDPDRYQQWVEEGHVPWWVRRVEDEHKAICSQLCDMYQRRLGVNLFDDRRLPGLVSPGDLWVLGGSPSLEGMAG